METFYIIVLSVLTIVLILYLTFMGIIISYTKNIKLNIKTSKCPDLWKQTLSGDIVYCTGLSDNSGTLATRTNASSITYFANTASVDIPGTVDNVNKLVNFNDQAWVDLAKSDGNTIKDQWKKWANTYKIRWDTVINT